MGVSPARPRPSRQPPPSDGKPGRTPSGCREGRARSAHLAGTGVTGSPLAAASRARARRVSRLNSHLKALGIDGFLAGTGVALDLDLDLDL